MNNIEIRELIAKKRLKHYEVAKALGVHRCTFAIWLQTELPQDKKEQIIKAINSIEI